MNDPEYQAPASGPSRRVLQRSVLLTLVGAAIVTVLFVLPAEFGVDPTGFGASIGLTRLAGAAAPDIDTAPRRIEGRYPDPPPDGAFDYFDPETLGEPYSRPRDTPFRSETMVIALDEFEQVEVKAVMNRGDAVLYSWKLLEGETVYTDFHADPHDIDRYPAGYFVRYHESESGAGSGSLVAPFTGNHGWYWLNIEEHPVRIELTVHGYYDSIAEIMRSFQ